ncbi:hypothetical protein [Bradyrhizobium sp. USDA 336]|uniref:hypothetical protein n=1 Tax=Bradyrhizobium sp. USDA 336 TaxID=3156311 RepID=UPI003834A989
MVQLKQYLLDGKPEGGLFSSISVIDELAVDLLSRTGSFRSARVFKLDPMFALAFAPHLHLITLERCVPFDKQQDCCSELGAPSRSSVSRK